LTTRSRRSDGPNEILTYLLERQASNHELLKQWWRSTHPAGCLPGISDHDDSHFRNGAWGKENHEGFFAVTQGEKDTLGDQLAVIVCEVICAGFGGHFGA
jgi:hypothetical protein